MNLREAPCVPTRYLVPMVVIVAGISLADCVLLTEVYTTGGPIWAGWAAIVFMTITCGLTILLAVVLTPVKGEPPPRPVILDTPVQDAGTDDLLPMPYQSYEATMQRRKPAPWCRLSEPKLARVIELYLDKGGSINVLTYGHICTRRELAELRQDLINHGLADEWKNSAVPHERGRAALAELLPHLLRE